jgi:hypothetical protein
VLRIFDEVDVDSRSFYGHPLTFAGSAIADELFFAFRRVLAVAVTHFLPCVCMGRMRLIAPDGLSSSPRRRRRTRREQLDPPPSLSNRHRPIPLLSVESDFVANQHANAPPASNRHRRANEAAIRLPPLSDRGSRYSGASRFSAIADPSALSTSA